MSFGGFSPLVNCQSIAIFSRIRGALWGKMSYILFSIENLFNRRKAMFKRNNQVILIQKRVEIFVA